MSLSVSIEISESITPFLSRMESALTDRTELHGYIAPQMEELTREYIRAIAPDRHATADRLGATRTNHLVKAADAIESGHDADSAVLTFPAATGLSRAFRDFDLRPTGGRRWLAIPNTASAYGRSPREFNDLSFVQFRDDLAGLIQRSQSDAQMVVVYWLKKEIHIDQDRTLLPSNEAYTAAAEVGAREFIRDLSAESGVEQTNNPIT